MFVQTRIEKVRFYVLVENFKDVLAIESTNHFRGKYHVLEGVISPIDGIGPEQLNIESLVDRVEREEITEVVMALNPNYGWRYYQFITFLKN